ncbi:trehalose-phosphatase [Jatrophihabitans sp.]|uniref:trehalose-phosphatase n=1 Tax=Jatrophihabitans sp. TaxID=1932789 RepID=UPI002B69CFF1|nr:trehalose-phosphatase [Jatrophihabitans sp.]
MHPETDRLAAIAARLPGALIALDFDGTLAPLVRDPATSRPVPGVVDILAALARAGAQVAIVTGRNASTALELGGLHAIERLVVSGLHGAETWRDGRLHTGEEPPGLAVLRTSLPPLLRSTDDKVWLEDKRLSLVVHTRQAADPDTALAELAERLPPLVAEQGLEIHPGKQVLEIRIPGPSKATALQELLTTGTSAALFAGDDLGDLPALGAVAAWAAATGRPSLTVAVGELPELRRTADIAVASPAELARLLARLLAAAG